jgi:hypothetical protein
MYLVVVLKLGFTALKVLDPVKTCIPGFRRKTWVNLASLDAGYEYARSIYAANILLKCCR